MFGTLSRNAMCRGASTAPFAPNVQSSSTAALFNMSTLLASHHQIPSCRSIHQTCKSSQTPMTTYRHLASLAYETAVDPVPQTATSSDDQTNLNQTNHPKNNNANHKAPLLDLSNLTFDDSKLAFGAIGSSQLLKHACLLSILRIPGLSKNSSTLINISNKIIGKKATTAAIRATLFNHFCGGEDLNGLIATSRRLTKMGIGSIVDYAAESEDAPNGGTCQADSDAWLDKNVQLTKDAIASANQIREATKAEVNAELNHNNFAFVAVKVTALSSPALLRKLTTVLNLMHHLFAVGCGHLQFNGRPSLLVDPRDHHVLMNKSINKEQFVAVIKSVWPSLTNTKIEEMFNDAMKAPVSSTPNSISFFQWQKFFTPQLLSTLSSPKIPSQSKDTERIRSLWFNAEDVESIHKVTQRMDRIAEFAKAPEVRLLIDAEQTFFQTAIDYFTFQQQEKWNVPNGVGHQDLKSTPAIIYNTYQMYLKSGLERLIGDAQRAETFGYKFALKMVRGAYMFQERRCAEECCYESPVHDSLEETHHSYNQGIEFMVNQLDQSELLCGTHNEDSAKLAASLLAKKYSGVNPSSLQISFGQLLGMCDHMSLVLSQAGCQIYKYVPYGPVDLVMPYLIRRAQENSSLLGSSAKETRLIWCELRHRFMERFMKH